MLSTVGLSMKQQIEQKQHGSGAFRWDQSTFSKIKKNKKKKEKEKRRTIHYSDCPTANGAKLAAFECGSFQSPRPIAMPYI